LEERFVVGEGSQAFAYTVHRFLQTKSVSPVIPEAEGVYLILDMTVENLTGQKDVVPREAIRIFGGARKSPIPSLSYHAGNRLDLMSLADITVRPNDPTRGVLAYEVPDDPSNDYYLRITPPNDTSDEGVHTVPIGTVDTIPQLEES
jgi:hypothetical protein